METDADGRLRVGLNFCSFQASLDQFDAVFNDWMMSRGFPPQPGGAEAGTDALLDPQRQFTTIEKVGLYFVAPYHAEGLAAAVFASAPTRRKAKSARLVVRKRVTDPSDPSRRFERGGFRFQVVDAQGQAVVASEFETSSTGRGICPADLEIAQNYTLQELFSPVPNVQVQSVPFTPEKRIHQIRLENQVTQPNTPYGG